MRSTMPSFVCCDFLGMASTQSPVRIPSFTMCSALSPSLPGCTLNVPYSASVSSLSAMPWPTTLP